jgi:hypothetical protein
VERNREGNGFVRLRSGETEELDAFDVARCPCAVKAGCVFPNLPTRVVFASSESRTHSPRVMSSDRLPRNFRQYWQARADLRQPFFSIVGRCFFRRFYVCSDYHPLSANNEPRGGIGTL